MKMLKQALCIIALLVLPSAVQARPVSYPGGWTLMTTNDVDSNSLHIHYTPDPKNSFGIRHEYMRRAEANADFIQHNHLLKRWNGEGSQANAYIKSGIGVAYDGDDTEAAAFTGLAADWENRRYFTSYENRFLTAGDIDKYAKHKARIGIAPYIGDVGDLHTWLMIQADYDAGAKDNFSATPLVRFFKGADMLEAGYNLDGGGLLNYVHRF
jgi:hypothetical protein